MEKCDLNKPYTARQIAEKYKISISEAIKLLNIGAKVELEHTDNLKTATTIASHHLWEFQDYYNKKTGLPAMERRLEHRSCKDAGSLKDENFDNSKKSSIFVKDLTKKEIQNVISGTSNIGEGTLIKTTADYLRTSKGTDSLVEKSQSTQKEERKKLTKYISENNLWVNENYQNYLDSGNEQQVYFVNEKYVVKFNDSSYYHFWLDYFYSLLLHNYFFPDTFYELIGFTENDNGLFAVVKQPFIDATEKTNLDKVDEIMSDNGFVNIRNNDYKNDELGVILEDLHDKNVLTKDDTLFFVDTVFYIKENIKYNDGGGLNTSFQKLINDAQKYNTVIDADLINSKSEKGHTLDNLPRNTEFVIIDASLFEKEKTAFGKVAKYKIAFHDRPSIDLKYWEKEIDNGARPPILIEYDFNGDKQLRVRDGNHRLNVYLNKNIKEIPAVLTIQAKNDNMRNH